MSENAAAGVEALDQQQERRVGGRGGEEGEPPFDPDPEFTVEPAREEDRCLMNAAEFCYDIGKRMLMGREAGLLTPKNPTRAVHLLLRACELGHRGAAWDLTCCSGEGENITFCWEKAAALYKQKAAEGDAVGQSNLAVCYYTGKGGLPQDQRTAAYYWQLSSRQNYSRAHYNIGVCYDAGHGVRAPPTSSTSSSSPSQQPSDLAFQLFIKSAEEGYAVAQYYVAVCRQFGRARQPRDLREALLWFRRAANQDHLLALSRLGMFILNGWHTAKNDVAAARCLCRAANWGDEPAWKQLVSFLRSDRQRFVETTNEEKKLMRGITKEGTLVRKVDKLTDMICLYFHRQWRHLAHQRDSSSLVEKQLRARLPLDLVERIRDEANYCDVPRCNATFFGRGRVERTFRSLHKDEQEEGDAERSKPQQPQSPTFQEFREQGQKQQLQQNEECEDKGEKEKCFIERMEGDTVTLRFCSIECAAVFDRDLSAPPQ
ncbi:hypothetical protein QOT17_003076 [Balamuthia mandrillaris]